MSTSNETARPNAYTMRPAIVQPNEIVAAAQAGSPEAFAELHAIYSRRLYKTILAITKSPEDTEDALQDTFLRAYLAIHTFEGRANLSTWMTRIAINSALMVLRKRRARPETLFDFPPDGVSETLGFEIKDPAPNPEQACDFHQRRNKLARAMGALDSCLRVPIGMRMADGLSVKEISHALNISETAVKSRLYRARLQLAQRVGRSVSQ